MNKALQALKNIKQYYCAGRICPQSVDACKICDIGIIENELKEKEEYDKILAWFELTPADFREACLLLVQWRNEGLNWQKYLELKEKK